MLRSNGCVGRSENWSDERVDRRNEVVGQKQKKSGLEKWGWIREKWADRTVSMSGSEWETEKENSPWTECVDHGASSVDRDWELSALFCALSALVQIGASTGSELGSFCASSGSELGSFKGSSASSADRGASVCGSWEFGSVCGSEQSSSVSVWER